MNRVIEFQNAKAPPIDGGAYGYDEDQELLIEEQVRPKHPNLYCVILLNDDYTPMDFVIWILEIVFRRSPEESAQLMLEVHNKGSSRVGVYTYDIARTKMEQVHNLATQHKHPLQCTIEIEEADDES